MLEFNAREIVGLENYAREPMFYKWFSSKQIEENATSCNYINVIKWDAFLNANPTTLTDEFNTVSTIGFKAHLIKLDYLRLQYKFRHLKKTAEKFYKNNDYTGDVNNNLLTFEQAYKLASNEIIELIDQFILTGDVSIQRDGKNQKRMLPNMYGLLNMPRQVKEEVEASDKDKMDKIFEKIKSGLLKLELGDEFSTPFMVLVDPITSLKLIKPCAIPNTSSSSNVYSSTDKWRDVITDTIKAINDWQEVYIHKSHLLQNQILIYPLSPNLIRLKSSKYMLPMLNRQIDKNSSDVAHSYLDFVLGGLLATEKTILRVDIKQS
ncbi:hypothetical protein [Borrelia puertoricensis]|uniref:hypothetical protein n=1 Tax=Borrelia puertoricensis TaxID=2756107 RepID=UPI001FF374A9|nr:hypothetical protein [Borrelia puertoricensis]UPA18398.1 hypothetical protein bpuSUM_000933 [Borrelia puertoricensis]